MDDVPAPAGIEVGQIVRLIHEPSSIGVVEAIAQGARRQMVTLNIAGRKSRVPVDQIEPMPSTSETPIDHLRAARFGTPSDLRRVLSFVRLTGKLADMIYSMETTNTEFHAHQFKPVLKLLASPTGNLLIADEVGLGKTIEAGLIWHELRARFDYRRLLVVCPKVLCPKWELELRSKFGVDARIYDAASLERAIEDETTQSQGFVAIAGLQGLRPRKPGQTETDDVRMRASDRLANALELKSADDPLFDMVVFDEAHHLRNQETQSHRLASLLRPVTRHFVLLSATPIHLGSSDLFSLLKLVDGETFREQSALEDILEANRPLIAAREALLSGKNIEDVRAIAVEASRIPLLQSTKQIQALVEDLEHSKQELPKPRRAELASRFEQANLLANAVNRTRRRDVEEFRVVRKVHAHPINMTEVEKKAYEAISETVRRYAMSSGLAPGFILATPQRMLASSAPATIARWRSAGIALDDEVEDTDDFGTERERAPLMSEVHKVALGMPNNDILEANDAKFDRLLEVLKEHFLGEPQDKVIIFSTFVSTIEYLKRRLMAAGMNTLAMHGDVKLRVEIVDRFASDPSVQILVSSEVGSEGIDLQFAKTMVNYDLPWNPMRVEQRIGRIDRLGQKSDRINVLNMFYAGTIDEKIYTRLYHRLGLCERALGGFEQVLGDAIRNLAPKLLSKKLTNEEIDQQLEQTYQALETKRQNEEVLEREAAALIAHGDHILREIHAAREMNRWIDGKDLARYLADELLEFYPGTIVRSVDEPDLYDVGLSNAARADYAEFLEANKLPRGRFFAGHGLVRCKIGRVPPGNLRNQKSEVVTQTHPLVRFVTAKTKASTRPQNLPALAVKMPLDCDAIKRTGLTAGRYVLAAEHWRFKGAFDQERIAYVGHDLTRNEPLDAEIAETLMIGAGLEGQNWSRPEADLDLPKLAGFCENDLQMRLDERLEDEEDAKRAELEDLTTIRLRTLERRFEEQTRVRQKVIDEQRARVDRGEIKAERAAQTIRMNEGLIRKLVQRRDERKVAIEDSRKLSRASQMLAIAVVDIIP
jgi:superfamily II DNA or RNA helicase